MKSKTIAIAFLASLVISLVALACQAAAPAPTPTVQAPAAAATAAKPAPAEVQYEPVSLKFMHNRAHGDIIGCLWTKEIISLAGKYSNGAIKITEYAEGEVAATLEEGVMATIGGSLDGIMSTQSAYEASGVKAAGVYAVPGLFFGSPDTLQVKGDRFWQQPLGGRKLNEQFEAKGLKVLDNITTDVACFWTRKSISSLNDLKGTKIRVPSSKPYLLYMQHIGVTPVATAAGEVYVALQQGMVDGLYTIKTGYMERRWNEVAPFAIINIPGGGGQFFLTMNLNKWNNLSQNVRQLLSEKVLPEARKLAAARAAEDVRNVDNAMLKSGVKFIELPREDVARLIEGLPAKVWDQLRADYGSDYVTAAIDSCK